MSRKCNETELARTENGRSFTCSDCGCIHIEYSSIAMNLSREEFFRLKHIADSISPEYCEVYFRNTGWKRKIQIHIKPTPMLMAFTIEEITELRRLFDETEAAIAVQKLLQQCRSDNFTTN